MFRLPAGVRDFFLQNFQTGFGTYQAPYSLGTMALTPDVKQQLGTEYDPSLPACVEFKNLWCYTSTVPYAFGACTGTTLPLPLQMKTVPRLRASCRVTAEFMVGYVNWYSFLFGCFGFSLYHSSIAPCSCTIHLLTYLLHGALSCLSS